MKHSILQKLMLIAVLLTGSHAFAQCFEVNGIYYYITSDSDLTAEVAYKGSYYVSNRYIGNVVIPENVTYSGLIYSVTSIGEQAFSYCDGLTSVTIPNNVTIIGSNPFEGTGWYYNQPDGILYLDNCCLGYKGDKPTGELSLKDNTRLIAWCAFNKCDGLTSITIPNSVTSIGSCAFSKCSGLTSVTIGDGVTSIGEAAFDGCTGLTSITIPNSVTSIGKDAFYGCTGLTEITLGSSVEKIGRSAFSEIERLAKIYSLNPTPPTCESVNIFNKVNKNKCRIYVPLGSAEDYKTTYVWWDFNNITEKEISGVEDTLIDGSEDVPAEYYNLQGVRVVNPERGLYIKRQGGETTKVVL